MKKIKLLTLVLCCMCCTVWSQQEKVVLHESQGNEQLLSYANALVTNSDDPTIKLANEEAKSKFINDYYNALVNNTLSIDQQSDVYTYIINRTVKNDWKPELKALVLYGILNNSTDLKNGQPIYMLNRHDVMANGINTFYKLIPALDPARGNNNLTEAQQLQLIQEKITELKSSDAFVLKCLEAFP